MAEYFTSKNIPVWPLKKDELKRLEHLMNEMERHMANLYNHPFGREVLNYSFLIFFYEVNALGQKYALPTSNQHSRKQTLAITYLSLVKNNFRMHRSVQYYAQLLFVSPKEFRSSLLSKGW